MGFIVKMTTVILTFIGRRIFLQIFTIEYLGITGLFGGILTVLSLADLGIETAMIYSYYKPLAEGDDLKLAALTRFYRKAYNRIAAVVAVLGLAVLPFLRLIVNTEQDIPYLEVYYLITLVNSVSTYLFVYKATVIRADQRGYRITRITIWMSVLRLGLQIAVMYATRNYMAYCAVSILATMLYNLTINYVADREYPQIKLKAELDPEEKRSIFQNIKAVFIYRIATVAIDNTDNILISTIVSTAILGVYGNYSVTIVNLNMVAGIIFSSLTPSIGNLLVKETPERQRRVFTMMQTISFWAAGVFTFCLYFLTDEFISLWIGPQYVFDEFTKIAILLVFYLGITQQPVRAFRDAGGLYQRVKNIMLITAAINIALSVLLGLWLGVAGIILATFISKVSTHIWYEPILLFRDFFDGKAGGYFKDQIINFVIVVACIALVRALSPVYEATGWLRWVAKGCGCMVVINAVFFLRYFRTEEFADIKSRLKRALKNS